MTEPRNAKQIIVIRKDLKMRRGKEIAQGAHASIAWLTERISRPAANSLFYTIRLTEAEQTWIKGNFRKITVQVNSEEELRAIHDTARKAGITSHIITDSGLTEFNGTPTMTALAIGPDWDENIDPVTSELKLY